MKKLLSLMLVLVIAAALVACTAPAQESQAPASSAPASSAPASSAPASSAPAESPAAGPVEIPVIIKATDSDFWQYVWVGAKNYAVEHPDQVSCTLYGPKSEADIDKQVQILEDVLTKSPKAVVIASTSSEATVPALESAIDAGVIVVTIDNKVKSDKIHTLLATDNKKGGALAAEQLVAALKAKNIPLKGKLGLVSAMAGVQVLVDRDSGFSDKFKELAPDVQILETKYVDNDIVKAMGVAKDLMAANPDLIGFFADNNHSGDGVARAISEENAKDKMAAAAFDSDPEEIKALGEGVLVALILQDPYGMGYKGVESALKALGGATLEKYVDTGATAVTKDNMNDEAVKGLLDPFSKKVAGVQY